MGFLLVLTFASTVVLPLLFLALAAAWSSFHWLGRLVSGAIVLIVALVCAVLWIQLFFFLNDIGTSYVYYITV